MKVADLLKDERAVSEIEKHKWLESEKAGYDIGFSTAAEEWSKKYGEEWAKYNAPELLSTTEYLKGILKKRGSGKKRK